MKEVLLLEESVLTQLTGYLILRGVMMKMNLFSEMFKQKLARS